MNTRTHYIFLIFIGLLVYFNALTNGFVGDDYDQIVRNKAAHNASNIISFFKGSTYASGGQTNLIGLYYRPIMLSTYSVIYSVFGPAPFFFHLVQISIHIANALLLYLLLKKYLIATLSFIAAMIFLVHPINQESVVYIANLQEPLFFFFGMLALLALHANSISIKTMITSSILLLLSFFSKESGILFLIACITYLIINRRKIVYCVPLLFSFATYLFFRYQIAHMGQAHTSIAPITSAPLALRLINIPSILWYYLKNAFIPTDLSTNQFWMVKEIDLYNVVLPFMFVIIVISSLFVSCLWLVNNDRKNIKPILLFLTWFISGLLLHSQILPLDATVASRWFYFPMVGLLAILGLITQQLKLEKNKFLIGSVSLVIILFSVRTITRNADWLDGLTLYSQDIKVGRKNFVLANAYVSELVMNEEYEKAYPYAKYSVEEHPYFANLNNLAIIYLSRKDIPNTKKTLEQAANNSRNYLVWENYANFLRIYKYHKEARDFTLLALRDFPNNAKLWRILAESEYLLGNNLAALNAAKKSYFLDRNEGSLYLKLKKHEPLKLDQREVTM